MRGLRSLIQVRLPVQDRKVRPEIQAGVVVITPITVYTTGNLTCFLKGCSSSIGVAGSTSGLLGARPEVASRHRDSLPQQNLVSR